MSSTGEQSQAKAEAEEAVELVLFQVAECYVYLIPPRKTAASYRYILVLVHQKNPDRNGLSRIHISICPREQGYVV
jgi:hypothetical protein